MWLNWKVRERACTRGRKVLRLVDGHNMFDRDCIVEEGASGHVHTARIGAREASYADLVFSGVKAAICDLGRICVNKWIVWRT